MFNYREITDELYAFYTSFIESGFSDAQAFELVKTYCNTANVENMILQRQKIKEAVTNLARQREKDQQWANYMQAKQKPATDNENSCVCCGYHPLPEGQQVCNTCLLNWVEHDLTH